MRWPRRLTCCGKKWRDSTTNIRAKKNNKKTSFFFSLFFFCKGVVNGCKYTSIPTGQPFIYPIITRMSLFPQNTMALLLLSGMAIHRQLPQFDVVYFHVQRPFWCLCFVIIIFHSAHSRSFALNQCMAVPNFCLSFLHFPHSLLPLTQHFLLISHSGVILKDKGKRRLFFLL